MTHEVIDPRKVSARQFLMGLWSLSPRSAVSVLLRLSIATWVAIGAAILAIGGWVWARAGTDDPMPVIRMVPLSEVMPPRPAYPIHLLHPVPSVGLSSPTEEAQ